MIGADLREDFMPALHNYEAGNIVLVIDSSGSIDAGIFGRFTDEMKMLLENITAKIWVIIADNHVQEAKEVTTDDLCDLIPKGYGGTDFRPAFAWLDEQGIAPTVLIYLTDLECYSYPDDPGYPVLWAGYGRWAKHSKVPFGEKIVLF
jgi:predicted metal-dependent peptidase